MLRMSVSSILVFAFCVASFAQESGAVNKMLKELVTKKPAPVNTLGEGEKSTATPAVHINANGVEYGPSNSNATVNKLRAARDSIVLPPTTTATKVMPRGKNAAKQAVDSFEGTSSRRAKPARIDTKVTTPAKSSSANELTPKPAPTSSSQGLSSVMNKAPVRKPAEPKLATKPAGLPTLAPARPQAPVMTAPSKLLPSNPTLATPRQETIPSNPSPLKPVRSAAQVPNVTEPLSAPIQLSPQIPFSEIDVQPATTQTPYQGFTAPRTIKSQQKPAAKPAITTVPDSQTVNAFRSQPKTSTSSVPDPFATNDQKPTTKTKKAVRRSGATTTKHTVLLSNRSPALVVKTHGQKTIRVGRVATYFITASNAGDLAAEDVIVSVNVPKWAELTQNNTTTGMVRIAPDANGSNVMRWSIRNLQPNAEQRLRIDLIPRESRPIELGVTWNFKSVSAMTQIVVQEPKLQLSVVGPSDIQFGETKLYTITVSNPGSGDAENVSLTLLPINDGAGVPSSRDLGVIKAGSRRTIEVELTARQAGELAVRAKASADGNLAAEGKQDVRVRRANLVVEATGPAKRFAGTRARYSVKVTNTGDATAHDIVAAAALPMASNFVNTSNAGVFDKERGRVRWNIGSLRPGAFQVVELTTVLNGAGSNKLDVRAIAANKLSAADDTTTIVEARADLKLSVEDPAGVIPPGQDMTYEVHIVNRGTKAANNVELVGFFSEGIEPVSVQGWRGAVEVGQVTMETIPQIAPGQEVVMKVVAKANRPGNHVFRAELSTRVPLTKLAVEEWTVFHSDDSEPGAAGVQQAEAAEYGEQIR